MTDRPRPGTEVLEETSLQTLCSPVSSLQSWEQINFCYLSQQQNGSPSKGIHLSTLTVLHSQYTLSVPSMQIRASSYLSLKLTAQEAKVTDSSQPQGGKEEPSPSLENAPNSLQNTPNSKQPPDSTVCHSQASPRESLLAHRSFQKTPSDPGPAGVISSACSRFILLSRLP